jgi:hypothetical protein
MALDGYAEIIRFLRSEGWQIRLQWRRSAPHELFFPGLALKAVLTNKSGSTKLGLMTCFEDCQIEDTAGGIITDRLAAIASEFLDFTNDKDPLA